MAQKKAMARKFTAMYENGGLLARLASRGELRFSEREQAILRLVVQGFTTREIAFLLSVSETTVKRTRRQIFDKMGVHNRSEAYAAILGVVVRQFTAVYEKRGRWYVAYVEELPGVNTQGRSLKEARENLEEALKLVIDANRELAARSQEHAQVRRETVSVEV